MGVDLSVTFLENENSTFFKLGFHLTSDVVYPPPKNETMKRIILDFGVYHTSKGQESKYGL